MLYLSYFLILPREECTNDMFISEAGFTFSCRIFIFRFDTNVFSRSDDVTQQEVPVVYLLLTCKYTIMLLFILKQPMIFVTIYLIITSNYLIKK